jgi:phosphate transport system substrate-binding protein
MTRNDHYRIYISFIILLLMLAITGCAAPVPEPDFTEAVPSPVTLTISGSGGTTSILQAVEAAFEASTPGYNLEVLSGTGTGGGVEGVTKGVLSVAAMARPPKDEELEATPTFQYVQFGLSGQAIFVAANVGEIDLTSDQAKAIFFGEITNWAEVGGPEGEIFLYVRDEGDSSTQALRGVIFGEDPFPEFAQVMTSQGDMIAAVEGTPFAAGFGTWPAVLAVEADVLPAALDGLAPSDSSYPITGELGIGYLEENQAAVQPLIDWLLSDSGREALMNLDVIVEW